MLQNDTTFVVEVARKVFEFFNYKMPHVDVNCNDRSLLKILDEANSITLDSDECLIILDNKIIKPSRQILPPNTDNAYPIVLAWFDSVKPISHLIPPKLIDRLDILDVQNYQSRWNDMHFREFHSKSGIGLYITMFIIFVFLIGLIVYFWKRYGFAVTCTKLSTNSPTSASSSNSNNSNNSSNSTGANNFQPSAPREEASGKSMMQPVGTAYELKENCKKPE